MMVLGDNPMAVTLSRILRKFFYYYYVQFTANFFGEKIKKIFTIPLFCEKI